MSDPTGGGAALSERGTRSRGKLALIVAPRRWPVQARLAVVSALLTAVILIGFAVVVGRLTTDRLNADFRQDLRTGAVRLAIEHEVRSSLIGRPRVVPDLRETARQVDAYVRVVDGAGRPVPGGDPLGRELGAPAGDGSIRALPGNLRAVDERVASDLEAGPAFLQYARDRSELNTTIGRLWLFLGAGVGIGTLLAGLAGLALAGWAMRPISGLTARAREIAATRDPSLRITVPASDDEVAELARTLEAMLRELDAARSETDQTIRRQREFVADASHELRTPLTSILANLELLAVALEEDGDGDERAAAASALRSSKRMSRLVGDLLLLARADAGRHGAQARCDLASIATEAVEEVRPVGEHHTLELGIGARPEVIGNHDELHRMALNLLENAVKHTPPGTTVSVDVDRGDGLAMLTVADDGPGLPADAEEQIFERFVRGAGPADRAGARDGTGLGLSIVRAVADSHGGSVTASTSERGGAQFEVHLPATDPSGLPGP